MEPAVIVHVSMNCGKRETRANNDQLGDRKYTMSDTQKQKKRSWGQVENKTMKSRTLIKTGVSISAMYQDKYAQTSQACNVNSCSFHSG